jgi:xanthine dehydrogenase small subunit
MIAFLLNRETVTSDLPAGTVTLDFLRHHRGLSGTKEGCREGDCGACLVLLGEPRNDGVFYRPVNSCLLPLGDVAGRHLVTIEGLNGDALNPIQQAFLAQGAAQCGFCTPGFIVSFLGFLLSSPRWGLTEATDALAGNLCRCTGHLSIRRAVSDVCATLGELPPARLSERVSYLVAQRWLPTHFLEIPARLQVIQAPALDQATGIPVAGGTDLFVQRPDDFAHGGLHFVSRRADLHGVRVEGGRCVIGAATPWADLEDSEVLRQVLPGIADHLKLAASRPIRHRATVGGNIVNASPIGDLTILLLALDATLALSHGGAGRELRLRDFFLGYKQLAKRPDELIAEIVFQVPAPAAVLSFEKVSRRTHLDIASVNCAMLAVRHHGTLASIQLAAGGVAPVPLYLRRTSEKLAGGALTAGVLREALATAQAEIAPISDVRGSADYKRRLLRQLLLAHFLKLAPELEKELIP